MSWYKSLIAFILYMSLVLFNFSDLNQMFTEPWYLIVVESILNLLVPAFLLNEIVDLRKDSYEEVTGAHL